MIQLDDKKWSELTNAYGSAANIPALLRQLAGFPEHDSYEAEPYFSLWSALCHQGDVYTASYAAVPHIVSLMEAAPERAHWSALLLVASIEISRAKGNGPAVPDDLAASYSEAIKNVPGTIALISRQEWDELFSRVAAASIAAVKGYPDLAEAILELTPDKAPAFMEWVIEQ